MSLNHNVSLNTDEGGKIILGDNVIIGPGSILRAVNHRFESTDVPIRDQGHAGGVIHVEEDVWLGANVMVLPGVRIGRGSIIGAGAIVTKDIPPYSIAVGNPAKVVRKRTFADPLDGTPKLT